MRANEVMRLLNISKMTLYRWTRTKDKQGNSIEPKIRYTRISDRFFDYNEDDVYGLLGRRYKKNNWTVVYARVATDSKTNREELDEQLNRMHLWAMKQGLKVDKIYVDKCSSLEFSRNVRKGLHSLIYDVVKKNVDTVLVESPDRIARFGFELLMQMFRYYKTKIIFVNDNPINPLYKNEVAVELKGAIEKIEKMYKNQNIFSLKLQ